MFLELSSIFLRDIKLRNWRLSANSIEPGQTERMCQVVWLDVVETNHLIQVKLYLHNNVDEE